MKRNIIKIAFLLIFFVSNFLVVCSQTIIVSGYVSDNETKEKIIGAIVFKDANNLITTNEFGYYSIKIPADTKTELKFSYLGYNDTIIFINSNENMTKNIFLNSTNIIEQVTVLANKHNRIKHYSFDAEEIKLLPSLTGEKDALKALQLLPGVQFGNEGTSDLYVRGGTPDQNLMLVDDMPMHFVNHLGSFVSIFDINAINDLKLYKAGIPSKYGGHLSSVLDIRLKDGNMNILETEVSAGIIATKVSLNGPIIKNKLSFVTTIRICNLFLAGYAYKIIYPEDNMLNFYSFYDLNIKLNYKISEKDKIDFTFYSGLDINKITIKEKMLDTNSTTQYVVSSQNSWGNYLNSLRWTRSYDRNLFQKFVIGYTKYHYDKIQEYTEKYKDTTITIVNEWLEYKSEIQDIVAKLDYDWYVSNKNRLNFGISAIYNIYNPGSFKSKLYKENLDTIYGNKDELIMKPYNFDIYVEDMQKIGKFTIFSGLRANLYLLSGKTWHNFQPRARIFYEPTKNTMINISYDRIYQNLHILTVSNSIVPADIWVPATEIAPPESSHHFSLGFSQTFAKNMFAVYMSPFYKVLNNMIDFKRYTLITDTMQNPTWENQIATNGTGTIYGFEFLIEKTRGKLTSWISYTYMKNIRQFDDLNEGKPYPFNFDRRHNLQVILQYHFNKNISLTANFMYGSGYPINLPIIKHNFVQLLEGNFLEQYDVWVDEDTYYYSEFYFQNEAYIYGSMNSYRMPDYHRLDLALNMSKEKKRGTRTWSINIYNAYNQQNAFFLFLRKDFNTQQIKLFKYTLFPIIPSFSYSFKF